MKEKLLVSLAILFLFFACNFHAKKEFLESTEGYLLPPLDNGIVYCQDEWLDDTLFHLTGEKILPEDSILNEVRYISFRDSQVVLHTDFKKQMEMIPIGNNDFIYHKDSSIIHTTIIGNSIREKTIYHLTMHPSKGKLVINASKNRMAFAYKYYHIIQVMDLEAKTVKTIDFKNGNHYYDHQFDISGHMDAPTPHIEYYCDAFGGEEYFYVLYWGHSNEEFINNVGNGWRWSNVKRNYVKTDVYQENFPNIIEQYDWNGNPVSRYLLEGHPALGEGYFVVNEKDQQFYLLASECYDSWMLMLRCGHQLMAYPFPETKIGD
ncbi:hypothetical protein FACS189421_01320 [Bacteroidia bacterium]|nr:hypothetical protein FACS189421_01320 [Bacteroidia bacterium]GHT04580.1 hypothetical protein FACS189423_07480 [Bacteroidia bacterium]GHT46081.1 hypothetical protein FACS189440_03350 [Bacteroidia bacterium]